MRHSVLVFVCTDARPPAVLLLKRTGSKGGWWQPVTGHVEPGETPREAAGREVWEETGWRPEKLISTPWTCDFEHRGWRYRHTVWIALCKRPFDPRLSDEHEEARWVDLASAERLLYWPDNREMLRRLRDWFDRQRRMTGGIT
ncbi:MAG: NUDIX pyrophosphatase [Alicyclobacillaceae bacterium]|nr:NUDIX pyrophosphatase [Alicyclobacillaceae bacterium]